MAIPVFEFSDDDTFKTLMSLSAKTSTQFHVDDLISKFYPGNIRLLVINEVVKPYGVVGSFKMRACDYRQFIKAG